MRKLVPAVLAALLIAALLVAGCGSSGTKSGGSTVGKMDAAKILAESNKKMQSISSVDVKGNYKIDVSGSTSGANENMNVTFEMQMDLKDPNNPQGHMVMTGLGQDSDVYLVGGFAYMNTAQGWVKTPIAQSGGIEQASPAELAKFAKNAENMKVVSDSGSNYVIGFDISSKYLQDAMKNSGASTQSLGSEGQQLFDSIAKSMKMAAVFTIDKNTMYVGDAKITMAVKDAPMIGNMNLNMGMAFSNYNQPVTVALPAEAAGAKEVSASEAGSIPGLPGLGL